jgi:hypothetical protein
MRYTALALLIAASAAAEPAPELVRLDHESADVQSKQERARFRAELDKVKAEVPVSSDNSALEARILARLEEEPVQRLALGRTRYEEQNYPAALAEADAVLRRDPTNKEALTLKHFSEGRAAMNVTPPPPVFHFVADQTTLPVKLRIKLPPATAPPAIVARRATPPAAPGPLPLLPLAGAAVLGLAAYEVSRSRAAYQSAEGLDDEHPKPVGPYQRLVAGAILAGAAGALVYTLGAAAVSAAPIALRIASSESGAINPGSTEIVEEMIPQTEAVAADTEQIVIKKGEILNRVWHSAWTKGSQLSGPNGYSYCRGACLPIHAARAVEGRGLDVGVINDARVGGLYAVTEDVTVFVRRSIGGSDEEILLRSPEDMRKLKFIREYISQIPSGK